MSGATSGDLETRRRVYEALERAVELEGEAREEWLAAQAPEVAEEVRAILAGEADSTFLGDRGRGLLALPAAEVPPLEPAPERVGHFRILSALGVGGMGQVFLAEQEEPVRRRVALKILPLASWGPLAEARFHAEREALGRLDHPNIGRILEAGTTGGGRPYFAMELIDGEPVTAYCDRHELSLPERLRIFTQVCRGTEHAHQRLVLHRDLKPSNVLVTEVDGEPVARIIDFGIAKWLDEEPGAGLTRDGRVGTPAYMSPEALAPGGTVDTRSDVFSLGVLLYNLLCGVLPWDAAPEAPFEFLRRRAEHEPRRPSTQLDTLPQAKREEIARRRNESLPGLYERLRGDLDWIVLRAVAREPAERYASAAELAADIERHQRGEPVVARPQSASYLLGKLVRRHRGVVAAGSAVVLALLVGVAGTGLGLVRARRAETAARAAAAEARQEASRALAARDEANATSDFLQQLFRGAAASRAGADRPPSQITARELLDEGAARVDELESHPLEAARLRTTLGGVYHELAVDDAARTQLERALSDLDRVQGPDAAPTRAVAERELGRLAYQEGDLVQAQARLDEAARIGRSELRGSEAARLLAGVLVLDARIARRQARFDDAERQLREAIGLYSKASDEHGLIGAVSALGNLQFVQGRAAEAETTYRDAVARSRRLLGSDHAWTAQNLENLAAAIATQGRLAEAAPLFAEALKIKRKILGDSHPDIAISLNNLGRLQLDLGHPAAAEPYLREALALRLKTLGPDHPDTAWSHDNLAVALDRLGRDDEARQHQLEALRIRRRALGANHPDIAHSLEHLGHLAGERGDWKSAVRRYRAALDIRRSADRAEDPERAETALDLALALGRVGRKAEAGPLLREAIAHLPEPGAKDADLELRQRIAAALQP